MVDGFRLPVTGGEYAARCAVFLSAFRREGLEQVYRYYEKIF